ncbi:MAG: hypothetical protein IV086_18045 [Hyphomonadaceae bacterium]|nr:hypothetical protein [Hyphomonadaceae bacterium]TPW08629.1 MAG: hypothetical protein FD124_251 [Alphaproteobacteria bacterium]
MRECSNLKRTVVVLAMLGALAACDPNQQQANQQQPNPFGPQQPQQPQTPGANGWPPMQPTNPNQPNQPGWPPGAQQPQQPGYQQQPGYPTQPGGALLQVAAPPGMQPLQSQSGAVFFSAMNGSRSASRLSQAIVQGLQGYFDGPLQVMGAMNDPSDMFGQVGFQATLQGQPVMGMIAVVSDGQNGGRGYLMLDRADRFNQTAPMMMNTMQQHAGMGGGPTRQW